MNRRSFLQALLPSALWLTSHKSFALEADALVPAIPILMFHKVVDFPLYPEDITSQQLAELFAYTWAQGFYPVNISDILEGRVDAVSPMGKMPLGISADDAHASIFFSRENSRSDSLGNEKSFMDIFSQSTREAGFEPRASFFLGAVNDDRVSRKPEGYFGNILPLKEIMDMWQSTAGLEFGYHTRLHLSMKGMDANQSRDMIEDQMEDFEKRVFFHALSVYWPTHLALCLPKKVWKN